MHDYQPRLRFAPSPNGYLHLGHAYSALVGWRLARQLGGCFLVRIEDIDRARSREDYVEAILEDLAWIGLTWEQPVQRQSQNFAAYALAFEKLRDMNVVYPCFATRREIAEAAGAGNVDPEGAPLCLGLSRNLASDEVLERLARGERAAWRLDSEKALALARSLSGGDITMRVLDGQGRMIRRDVCPDRWGDAVILRKDIPASYHLAVVVDDAAQEITHVTRGADLEQATDLHRLLQVLLELPEPIYHHHRLIVDETGQKLSKSAKAQSLRALRHQGAMPADIFRAIGLDPPGLG